MKSNKPKSLITFLVMMGFVFMMSSPSSTFAQDALKGLVTGLEDSQSGMSLWQIIQSGGFIMIILCLLSVAVCSIASVIKIVPRFFWVIPASTAREMILS